MISKCAFHEVIEEHAFVLAGCLLACEFHQRRTRASRLVAASVGLETVLTEVMGRPLAVIRGVLPVPFD